MNLNDVLNDEAQRASIIEDICRLVDDEVGKQRGISGVAVKAGYKLVQGVKPGFVRKVVQALLPEFAAALEPIREQAVAQGQPVGSYFDASPKRSSLLQMGAPKAPTTVRSEVPTASSEAPPARTSKAPSPA